MIRGEHLLAFLRGTIVAADVGLALPLDACIAAVGVLDQAGELRQLPVFLDDAVVIQLAASEPFEVEPNDRDGVEVHEAVYGTFP